MGAAAGISPAHKTLLQASRVPAKRFPKAHEAQIPSDVQRALKANFFDVPVPGEKGYYPELALLMERVNAMLALEGSFYLALARLRSQNPKLRLVVQSGRKGTPPRDKLLLRLAYSTQ